MIEEPINMIILIIIVLLLSMNDMKIFAYAVVIFVFIYEQRNERERFDTTPANTLDKTIGELAALKDSSELENSTDVVELENSTDTVELENPTDTVTTEEEQELSESSDEKNLTLPSYDTLNLTNIETHTKDFVGYKGNIHTHEVLKLNPDTPNDRMAEALLNKPGTDYKRQLVGRKDKKNYLNRFIAYDIDCAEQRPWWYSYDL